MKMSISMILTAASMLMISACSTTPPQLDTLERARAELSQVESSPQAGAAASDILATRDAIAKAAEALEEGEREEARDLSYLALRSAQIAQQKVLTAEANARIRQGQEERQQVLLQARESERSEAQQRASSAQQRATSLEAELADLKARKTDRGVVFTLQDVLFETGQSTLKAGAMQTLSRIAGVLEQSPEQQVIIEGYTDSVGSEQYNQELSERRAAAVRAALVSQGVSPQQLRTVGRGESFPVASNDTAAGRQQNRRVEIIVSANTQRPTLEAPATDSAAME